MSGSGNVRATIWPIQQRTMNPINLDEIRILQDVLISKTGVGECEQARGAWILLIKDWKGK